MRALVVYESMFGNNRTIAQAIADGLSSHGQVEIFEVGTAPTAIGPHVDLLVVGAPTHALGLSNPKTRESAAQQAEHGLVSSGIGVREWLTALEAPSGSVRAVAYDTCTRKPRWIGWLIDGGARSIERRLRRRGFRIAAAGRHFHCSRTPSRLLPGEVARAQRWGGELAASIGQS